MYTIRKAHEKDLNLVNQFLQSASLDPIENRKPIPHFFVVEQIETQKLLGTIGMEIFSNCALLRSFVVKASSKTQTLILYLLHMILFYAQSLSLNKLYLITHPGNPFFAECGFQEVELAELPMEIKHSKYFQKNQSKGVLMVYDCG